MPTTPNGTVYTAHTFTTPGGSASRYVIADNALTSPGVPLLFFIHGYGGDDTQFSSSGTWAALKNWLMDNGWAYTESVGGSTTNWGNAAGRTAYQQVWAHVDGALDIGPVVILGRSMGGLLGYWFATQDPTLSARASGLIEASGVTDLLAMYDGGTVDPPSILAAYGAANRAELIANSAGHDPMDFDPALWNGKSVLQVGATGDVTVPFSAHGLAWQSAVASRLLRSETHTTTGGDHNSSTGGDAAATTAMVGFLQAVTTSSRRRVTGLRAMLDGRPANVVAVKVRDDQGRARTVDLSRVFTT